MIARILMGLVRVALLVVFMATLLGLIKAYAHESWINEGGYRGPDGSLCCGKSDCFELTLDHDVREVRGGYSVAFVFPGNPDQRLDDFVPYSEAPPSEDRRFHLCVRWDDGQMKRRCFFAPAGST
jgi:hypothetical protein